MPEIRFYETAQDAQLRYAVIIARSEGKWVFCKHRLRDTYECPGGHREEGEDIFAAAHRELYEETGAQDYTLTPVCPYSVTDAEGTETFGMLFYAEISSFSALPDYEMERVLLFDQLPESWTYPAIQPALLEHVRQWASNEERLAL